MCPGRRYPRGSLGAVGNVTATCAPPAWIWSLRDGHVTEIVRRFTGGSRHDDLETPLAGTTRDDEPRRRATRRERPPSRRSVFLARRDLPSNSFITKFLILAGGGKASMTAFRSISKRKWPSYSQAISSCVATEYYRQRRGCSQDINAWRRHRSRCCPASSAFFAPDVTVQYLFGLSAHPRRRLALSFFSRCGEAAPFSASHPFRGMNEASWQQWR